MKGFRLRTIVFCSLSLVISQQVMAFDLISAILSKTQGLPGRIPVSLTELRSMLSPEVLQKMLGSKLPSIESLRSDPDQVRRILQKLKPIQGRLDPQILEILSSTFQQAPPAQHPSTVPAEYAEEPPYSTETTDHSVKRGITHPRPGHILRRPLPKFSSEFRRRPEQTTPMIPATTFFGPPTDYTEAPPPYEHITDPNIRNHRLYGWRTQNFTMIDSEDDLEMEESASRAPSLIPLTFASEEALPGSTPTYDPEEAERPREPLRESSTENEPIQTYDDNTGTYFRPSPLDLAGAHKVFQPGQEFYTSTIKTIPDPTVRKKFRPGHSHGHGNGHGLPPYRKQDRILHNSGPGQQEFQNPNQRFQPIHGNYHPFASYTDRNEMYSPSHYHHNKFHYHHPNTEDHGPDPESPGQDKVDSSWTPTFVLLGGLVAASALVAFILPSFLTTMTTAGKDNEAAASEPSADIWHDIKGLYSDLSHIAKGDFGHFNKDHQAVQHPNEEETKSSTDRVFDEQSPEPELVLSPNSRGRGRGRQNETLQGSPLHPALIFNQSEPGNKFSRRNSTFLKEWAKVQLQLIDN